MHSRSASCISFPYYRQSTEKLCNHTKKILPHRQNDGNSKSKAPQSYDNKYVFRNLHQFISTKFDIWNQKNTPQKAEKKEKKEKAAKNQFLLDRKSTIYLREMKMRF